jgi:hypothetical protein
MIRRKKEKFSQVTITFHLSVQVLFTCSYLIYAIFYSQNVVYGYEVDILRCSSLRRRSQPRCEHHHRSSSVSLHILSVYCFPQMSDSAQFSESEHDVDCCPICLRSIAEASRSDTNHADQPSSEQGRVDFVYSRMCGHMFCLACI